MLRKASIDLVWAPVLLLGALAGFILLWLLGILSPGSAIGIVKENEQANYELYTLLEQEACIEHIPFEELRPHAIIQGSDSNSVEYYSDDGTLYNVDLDRCIDETMSNIQQANYRKVFSDFIKCRAGSGYDDSNA